MPHVPPRPPEPIWFNPPPGWPVDPAFDPARTAVDPSWPEPPSWWAFWVDHVPSGADSVPTGLSNTTDEGVGCYTIFVGAFGILMAALLLVVGIDSLDGSNYDPACVERAERSYADTRTTLQYNGPTAGNKKDYIEAVCG